MELRREAELQAVSIRIDGQGYSQRGDSFDNSVNVFNGSDQIIFDVHLGVIIDGKRCWSQQPIVFVNPNQIKLAQVAYSKPAEPQIGFGTFVDAYGRKWSLDENRGLKLENAFPITATKVGFD